MVQRPYGRPSPYLHPIGIRRSLTSTGSKRPPYFSKLIQWFQEPIDGILVSKIGSSGSEVGRGCVNGAYIQGDGIDKIKTLLPNTPLTYIDFTTGLEVADVTDSSGDFLIPTNGITKLVIDSHTFWCEEGTGNYIGATDGEYYEVSPNCAFVTTTRLYGYADDNGYTIAVLDKHFWDENLTVPIDEGAILVKKDNVNASIGYSTEDGIYVTDDDFIYETEDGFVYLI